MKTVIVKKQYLNYAIDEVIDVRDQYAALLLPRGVVVEYDSEKAEKEAEKLAKKEAEVKEKAEAKAKKEAEAAARKAEKEAEKAAKDALKKAAKEA